MSAVVALLDRRVDLASVRADYARQLEPVWGMLLTCLADPLFYAARR